MSVHGARCGSVARSQWPLSTRLSHFGSHWHRPDRAESCRSARVDRRVKAEPALPRMIAEGHDQAERVRRATTPGSKRDSVALTASDRFGWIVLKNAVADAV
jgi:hypothetical protein